MLSAGSILLVISMVGQFGAGIMLNSCIISHSFESLKNGGSFHPASLIYFTMGLVNVLLQCVITAQNGIRVFWYCLFYIKEIRLTLSVLTQSVVYCNFWLTAWMCTYYCVTIANLSHQLIVRLKRLLSSFLPHVLVLSITGTAFMGLLSIGMVNETYEVKPSTNLTGSSCSSSAFHLYSAFKVTITLLGCSLPFTLALTSTAITIFCLIRHINRMKHNVSGYTRSSLRTLINAARTMSLFLVFSVLFYVFQLLFTAGINSPSEEKISIISSFIIMSFPMTEAIIIIQALPKLREKIWGKFCFKKEKNESN